MSKTYSNHSGEYQQSPRRDVKREKRPKKQRKENGAAHRVIKFKESDILQRWLVTTEFCPTCGAAKKDNADDIKSGALRITDVGDDKGFDILSKLNMFEVPLFVIELKDGTYIIDE